MSRIPKASELTVAHKVLGAAAKTAWLDGHKTPSWAEDEVAFEASKTVVLAKHGIDDTEFWGIVGAVYEAKVGVVTAIDTTPVGEPIHARGLVMNISGAPDRFMYCPGGINHIKASRAGKPTALWVQANEKTAAALNKSLAAHKHESGRRVNPFFDFEHRGGEASFHPKEFVWDTKPEPGVYVAGEWTSDGRAKVEGKVFQGFSPSFFPDKEPAKTSKESPAMIVGLDFCGGGVVNLPAFRSNAPLWSKEDLREDGSLIKASERGMEEIRAEVREAMDKHSDYKQITPKPGEPYKQGCWLRDVLIGTDDDAWYAIIQLSDGKLVRHEISWIDDNDADGDGDIEFVGEAEPTRQVYAKEENDTTKCCPECKGKLQLKDGKECCKTCEEKAVSEAKEQTETIQVAVITALESHPQYSSNERFTLLDIIQAADSSNTFSAVLQHESGALLAHQFSLDADGQAHLTAGDAPIVASYDELLSILDAPIQGGAPMGNRNAAKDYQGSSSLNKSKEALDASAEAHKGTDPEMHAKAEAANQEASVVHEHSGNLYGSMGMRDLQKAHYEQSLKHKELAAEHSRARVDEATLKQQKEAKEIPDREGLMRETASERLAKRMELAKEMKKGGTKAAEVGSTLTLHNQQQVIHAIEADCITVHSLTDGTESKYSPARFNELVEAGAAIMAGAPMGNRNAARDHVAQDHDKPTAGAATATQKARDTGKLEDHQDAFGKNEAAEKHFSAQANKAKNAGDRVSMRTFEALAGQHKRAKDSHDIKIGELLKVRNTEDKVEEKTAGFRPKRGGAVIDNQRPNFRSLSRS